MTTPDKNPQVSKDTKVIDQLFAELDNYKQSSQVQRSDINDIYAAYVGEMDDPKDQSKSQEKIMKLRTEVNYIVPSIFSGNPEIEVTQIGEEDRDIAFVAEKIINHRINTIPQAYEKIEAWVKQAVVFGTSLMSVVWNFEAKDNEDKTRTPIKDEPDLMVPNILDCFYNPIIPDVECQPSIIFRSVLSLEEVRENTAYNENRKKVEGKNQSSSDPYNSSRQVQSDRIDVQRSSNGTIEIYERITEDRIQTVADGKERLLLRDVENPYGMYIVKLIHEPNAIPNRFDGFGVGHNTLGLGRLIQKLSNRLQDAVNLGNNPHFLGRKGAGIDKRQLVIRAGGLTEVDGDGPLQEAIQPLQVPDIKSGALALLNRFDDEHKRASGANDLMQGAASNKTLGQDQLASTYSSSRFELINRRFKQALADVGRLIFKMEVENLQSVDSPILKIFPSRDDLETVLERNPNQDVTKIISRETAYEMLINARENGDIDLNVKVKGETNVARNKDMLLKQFSDWYNLFGPILPPQNQLAAAKKWLELRGIDDADKLVPSMDEQETQAPQMAPEAQGVPQETPMMNPGMMQQGFPTQPM